ncbi:MAG TPA: hypothetical protein VNX28_16155 [Gemmataceae bacterium]|jgi:hypothetical protein|nr:hypothetical protein [Gemmataceae bacterium]
MKTEIRLAPHSVLPGQNIIELWWDGQFIGQVTDADGPGCKRQGPLGTNVNDAYDGTAGVATGSASLSASLRYPRRALSGQCPSRG